MVLGRQQFGGALVLHDGADLVAHELRSGVVRLLVHQEVGVGVEVADAAAFLPLRLVGLVALVFRHVERRTGRLGMAADGERRVGRRGAARRVVRLVPLLALGLHRPIARRQAEVGGALEDGQVFGLAGDDRNHLHARRAGADHADAQAAEVDTLMRPQAGVVPLALEVFQALEVGHARRREIARRHDAVACADLLAAVGLQRPFARLAVERRRDDAGVELHVAPEVEAVGDVVDVFQDLGLRAVALRPLPLLLQLVGEAVGILQALHVAARTGVAVPEPGPADARAGFVGPDFQAHAAQAMDGIETGQAAADDGDIELALIGGRGAEPREASGICQRSRIVFAVRAEKSSCLQRSPASAGLASLAAGHIAGAGMHQVRCSKPVGPMVGRMFQAYCFWMTSCWPGAR